MYNREFKVTLKVSLPLSAKYKCDEQAVEELLTKKLLEAGMHSDIWEIEKVPLEHIHKDYYGDELDPEDDLEDITKFDQPVGYICPDGKFFGGDAKYDPLMHVIIAQEVWEAYKDNINTKLCECSSAGLDYDLERWGFIKVRDNEIRYYVPMENQGQIVYWTDAQRETVRRYMQHFQKKYEDCHAFVDFTDACGHKKPVSASQFCQMDKFAIIKCFDFSDRLV